MADHVLFGAWLSLTFGVRDAGFSAALDWVGAQRASRPHLGQCGCAEKMSEGLRPIPMGRKLAYDGPRRDVCVQLHGRAPARCNISRLATLHTHGCTRHVVPSQEHQKLCRLLGVMPARETGVLQRGTGLRHQRQQCVPVQSVLPLRLRHLRGTREQAMRAATIDASAGRGSRTAVRTRTDDRRHFHFAR